MKKEALSSRAEAVHRPKKAVCECGFVVCDGEVIRSRVVHIRNGQAKCRCKRWVEVPVGYLAAANA